VRQVTSDHPGINVLRLPEDSFSNHGPTGKHQCLVLEPIYGTRGDLPREPKLQITPIKALLRRVLLGLDYLHAKCEVIHTGESDKVSRALKSRT
jgi:serine/threonine-protein kinase SRPK3